MNRKLKYILVMALILTAMVIVLRRTRDTQIEIGEAIASHRNEMVVSDRAARSESSPALSGPNKTGLDGIDETHKKDVRTGMRALFEGLKKKGILRDVPPISTQLQDAIKSGDTAIIHRAFRDAIYSPSARMSEAIPAIKAYIGSSNPYLRYLAADALLRVGDHSGVETLLKLVQNDKAAPVGAGDLRFDAAATLAAFGVNGAAESIRNLYSKTKEGEVLDSLVALGAQASEANTWRYVSSRLAIESYAKVGSTKFVPQITETFEQSDDPATKNAAAWALARMNGADQYVKYLSEAARPAIESSTQSSFNASTEALRYLGGIQTPQAVRVLEDALESSNPIAVQYATINLLFNQPGGSQKADLLVLRELQSSPRMLGTELAMQIASKSNNAEIHAAAQSFAQRTGSDSWRYWGVERSSWPVQNWIYDYVVTLN